MPHRQLAGDFPHANLPGRLMRMVGRDDDVLTLSTRLDRFALRHHRRRRRRRQNHGCGGGRTSPDRGFRRRRAVRRSRNAERSRPGGHGRGLHAGAVGSIRRCDAQPDRLSAGQADSSDPRHLRASHRGGGSPGGAHLRWPRRKSTSWRRAAKLFRSRASMSTGWMPLACPPDDPGLTAAVAQTFPATQLFVERAAASGARLDFSDADAAIVASICRKLDGVALAIELAARRVEAYGLQQTAALLDQRLTLLWLGPRTAPPRQKTLQATLDWSYGLLSELERVVLRRLAVFVGHFTLDAALAVVTSADRRSSARLWRHRQPRRQVDGRDPPDRGNDALPAAWTRRALTPSKSTSTTPSSPIWPCATRPTTGDGWSRPGPNGRPCRPATERAPHFAGLNNVRAALEWCFGVNGNAEIGVGLAAAAAPVFLAMSLLPECHRWSERAILALDDATRGGRRGDASSGGPGIVV